MPHPNSSNGTIRAPQDSRRREILLEQVRLLYANANVGVGVTILAATLVARLQWGIVSNPLVVGWWLYMILVSISRFILALRFRNALPDRTRIAWWSAAFAAGAGLSGAGWGGAGILLYPPAHLTNQVFLVFVVGGMMLGAASLLAPRPEAFLAFLLPTGFAPAIRLLMDGGEHHSAMGVLATVFTIATLITTHRIHRTVDASLKLQFDNRDLVEDLQAAKGQTEALNQALEIRVQERTADLRKTTEQLRAEISQREQMEEELLRARKLESLGVLAGGIAHDFNNFLTIVRGNIELAKTHLDPDERAQEFLDQMADACQRAVFLSSQLLTFAKGGAPVRRVVSVAGLVTDAVNLVRAGAAVSVSVQIANDLRCALVDPGQIGQVLHNILLNARQAMPVGGIIEVRAENVVSPGNPEAQYSIRISIRDYGCGIRPEILPLIFDPYFTTRPGGSGLGLATAYAIVAKHGGNISVESQPGVGTTFTIDLPASDERPVPGMPVAADVPTGSERLLVMDDEEPLRNLLKAVLVKFGYAVDTAADGAEAIAMYENAMLSRRPYDAVLLDLTVRGGMGGLEAAAKLKELDSSSRLIVSSGYSDAPIMSDFARYGFDAVIPKPWTATELGEVFRKVLVGKPDRKIN